MNLKHLLIFSIALLVSACSHEETTPNQENYILFTQQSHTLGILNDQEWFEIPVVATQSLSHDRNIGVEILVAESSAIEDKHFEMESHNLTLRADKLTTSVRIRGIAQAITPNVPLELKLRLVLDSENVNDKANIETTITLKRCCEFDINNFEGYAVITSTWSMQYMNTDSSLVHTHADEKEEGVVVIENMFYEGYDIRVKLHSDDRLNPIAELCGAQVLGSTGEAFGTIYGNGKLMMSAAPEEYLSYYSTCENFLLLYTEMYVEEVGTVGYFGHILEWISDDEAERIMREGF
jgi:hypothetical protein